MINWMLNAIRFSERLLVSTLLILIVLIAASDVILRLTLSEGLSWSAPVLKISLLWVSLFGAILATGSNSHIRIDVLEHYLPKKYSSTLQRITNIISASVCFLIAYHAYRFVAETYDYQDLILNGTPAWIVQAIIPLSFALIGLRFSIQTFLSSTHTKEVSD